MEAFFIAFNALMILTPAGASLFFRERPGQDIDRPRVHRLRIQLWVATIICLLAYGTVVLLTLLSHDGARESLRSWMKLPWWTLFFLLWFGFTMRLLSATRPAMQNTQAAFPRASEIRTAALKSRVGENPVPARFWFAGWLIWLGALVALILGPGPAAGTGGQGGGSIVSLPLLLHVLVVPIALIVGPWAIRLSMREPEPLDPAGNVELQEAYASYRCAKAWGFYALGIALVLVFSLLFALLAWSVMSGPMLGVLGAVAGTLIGVGGGIFGTLLSIRRMRIKEQLERLV